MYDQCSRSIQWNIATYAATLLIELYSNDTGYDLTLDCLDYNSVWLHLLLATCREYFVSLFYRNETDSDYLDPLSVESCANQTLCTLDEFIA